MVPYAIHYYTARQVVASLGISWVSLHELCRTRHIEPFIGLTSNPASMEWIELDAKKHGYEVTPEMQKMGRWYFSEGQMLLLGVRFVEDRISWSPGSEPS